MKNTLFKESPIPSHPRSSIDLSYESKFSGQVGRLIPFLWYDVTPGDTFRIRSEILVKLSPMLAPVLHRMDVYTHYFFVPYDLLMFAITNSYGDWEAFITGDQGGYYTNNVLPYVTIDNGNKAYFAEGTLANYLGLPVIAGGTTVTQDIDICAFPGMAYNLIWDEYYRDENLQAQQCGPNTSFNVPLVGGDRNGEISEIFPTEPYRRAYEKDYFRGALPNAYAGAAGDIELDLDIEGLVRMGTGATGSGNPNNAAAGFPGGSRTLQDDFGGVPENLYYPVDDASAGKAVLELTELRRAMALQKYLDAENRGGNRYREMLLGVFGVISDDRRHFVPQYIGGGKQAVQIGSILNHSQVLDPTAGINDGAGGVTVTVDPQSFESGKALAVGRTNTAGGYFKEHGLIMGICSVLPRTAYGCAQIERYWRKTDREEFFVPQLQRIGDQEILQSEVGYDATGADADDVFGYAPRWAEYKFKNSYVAGAFGSTLDYWHMANIGDTSGAGPDLNTAFILCDEANDEVVRIFADQTGEDTLYFQVYNDVQAIRPMLTFDTL